MEFLIPVITLVTEIFKIVGVDKNRKYIDRMLEIKETIRLEEKKGYWSNDAKIEGLYKELANYTEIAQMELVRFLSQPK